MGWVNVGASYKFIEWVIEQTITRFELTTRLLKREETNIKNLKKMISYFFSGLLKWKNVKGKTDYWL